MSTPFVTQLRTQGDAIRIGEPTSSDTLHLRVEIPEVWDVVRIDARSSDTVRAVKLNALHALLPNSLFPDEFSVKLRGREILDESASLESAGARDGSIFLVTHRRRRPVR